MQRLEEFGGFHQAVFWKDQLQVECTHSQNRELKTKMAKVEKAMEEKDEILELLTASKDSLEKDAIDRKAQIVSVHCCREDGCSRLSGPWWPLLPW